MELDTRSPQSGEALGTESNTPRSDKDAQSGTIKNPPSRQPPPDAATKDIAKAQASTDSTSAASSKEPVPSEHQPPLPSSHTDHPSKVSDHTSREKANVLSAADETQRRRMSVEEALASIEALTDDLIGGASKRRANATETSRDKTNETRHARNAISYNKEEGGKTNVFAHAGEETSNAPKGIGVQISVANAQGCRDVEPSGNDSGDHIVMSTNETPTECGESVVTRIDEDANLSVDKTQDSTHSKNNRTHGLLNTSVDKSQESLDEMAAMALFNVVNEPAAHIRRNTNSSIDGPLTAYQRESELSRQDRVDSANHVMDISSDLEDINAQDSQAASNEKQNGGAVLKYVANSVAASLTSPSGGPQSGINPPNEHETTISRDLPVSVHDDIAADANEKAAQKNGSAQNDSSNEEVTSILNKTMGLGDIRGSNSDTASTHDQLLSPSKIMTFDIEDASSKKQTVEVEISVLETSKEDSSPKRGKQLNENQNSVSIEILESSTQAPGNESNKQSDRSLEQSEHRLCTPTEDVPSQPLETSEGCEDMGFMISNVVSLSESPDKEGLFQTRNATSESNGRKTQTTGKIQETSLSMECDDIPLIETARDTNGEKDKDNAKRKATEPGASESPVPLDLSNSPEKSPPTSNRSKIVNEPLNLSTESNPTSNDNRTTPIESHFDMDGPLASPFSRDTNSRASSPGSSNRTISPIATTQPPVAKDSASRVNKRKRKDPMRSQKYKDKTAPLPSSVLSASPEEKNTGTTKDNSPTIPLSRPRGSDIPGSSAKHPLCLDDYVVPPRFHIKQEKQEDFVCIPHPLRHQKPALTPPMRPHQHPHNAALQGMFNMAAANRVRAPPPPQHIPPTRFSPPEQRFTVGHHPAGGNRFPNPHQQQQTTLHVIEPENPWAPGLPPPPPHHPGMRMPPPHRPPPPGFGPDMFIGGGNPLGPPRVSMSNAGGGHMMFHEHPAFSTNNRMITSRAGNPGLVSLTNHRPALHPHGGGPALNPGAIPPHLLVNPHHENHRPMLPPQTQTVNMRHPDFMNPQLRYNMNQGVSLLPHSQASMSHVPQGAAPALPPETLRFRPILGGTVNVTSSGFTPPRHPPIRPRTQSDFISGLPPQPITIVPSISSPSASLPVSIVAPVTSQRGQPKTKTYLIEKTSVAPPAPKPTAAAKKSVPALAKNFNAPGKTTAAGSKTNAARNAKQKSSVGLPKVLGTLVSVSQSSITTPISVTKSTQGTTHKTILPKRKPSVTDNADKTPPNPKRPALSPKPTPRENKSIISSDILKKKYNTYKPTQPPAILKMAPIKTHKCLGCGDEFLFKTSLANHTERKSMEIEYNCSECKKVITFWNRCTLFAHAKGHARGAKAYRLNINNAVISVLPDELMPCASLPALPPPPQKEKSPTAESSAVATAPDKEKEKQDTGKSQPEKDKRPTTIDLSKAKSAQQLSANKSKTNSKSKDGGTSSETPIEIPDSPTEEKAPSSLPQSDNEGAPAESSIIVNNTRKTHEQIRLAVMQHYKFDQIASHYTTVIKGDQIFYECPECKRSDFRSLAELQLHFRSAANGAKDIYEKCPVCKMEIRGRCAMKAHKRIHQRKRPYVCPECAETIEGSSNVFKKHLNNRCLHNQRSLLMRCTLCNIVILFDSNTVTSHYIEHHSTKYYKCTQCPMAFKTEANFIEHRLTMHNIAAPSNITCSVICKCALCDTVFQNVPSVITHFETTHFPKLGETACFVAFKCTMCQPQKLFNSKESYAKHVLALHKVKVMNYMCNLCGDALPSSRKLDEHRALKHVDATCCLTTGWSKAPKALEMLRRPAVAPLAVTLTNVPKIFKCEKCHTILKDKELYEKHMQKHRFVEKRKQAGEKVQSIKIKINGSSKTGEEYKVIGSVTEGGEATDQQGGASSETRVLRKRKVSDDKDQKEKDKNSNEIDETGSDTESTISTASISPAKKKRKLLDSIEKNAAIVKVRKEFMGQVPTAPIPKNRFACSECVERLPTQQALREHLQSVHNVMPQYPCHLCGNTYTSAGSVFRHIQTVHEGKSKDKKYWCWVCMEQNVKKGYPTWKLLEKHLTAYHKVHKNHIDYSKFSGGIQNGMNGIDTDDDAKSDVSGSGGGGGMAAVGDNGEAALAGLEDEDVPVKRLKTSEDLQFVCAKCSFTTNDRKKFAEHILKHKLDSSELQCQECGLCFTVLPALKRHLFMVHKQRDMDAYKRHTGVDVHREEQRALAARVNMPPGGSVTGSPFKSQIPNGIRDVQKKVQKKPKPKPVDKDTTEQSTDPLVTLECNVCYRTFEDDAKLRTHMRSHGMAFIRSRRAPFASPKTPVVEPAK